MQTLSLNWAFSCSQLQLDRVPICCTGLCSRALPLLPSQLQAASGRTYTYIILWVGLQRGNWKHTGLYLPLESKHIISACFGTWDYQQRSLSVAKHAVIWILWHSDLINIVAKLVLQFKPCQTKSKMIFLDKSNYNVNIESEGIFKNYQAILL